MFSFSPHQEMANDKRSRISLVPTLGQWLLGVRAGVRMRWHTPHCSQPSSNDSKFHASDQACGQTWQSDIVLSNTLSAPKELYKFLAQHALFPQAQNYPELYRATAAEFVFRCKYKYFLLGPSKMFIFLL